MTSPNFLSAEQLDRELRHQVREVKRYREALELFADPKGWPPSLREKEYVVHMRALARTALKLPVEE